MHRAVPVLLAVLALPACAVSQAGRAAPPMADHVRVPPPPPASLVTTRWEYFCINGPTVDQLNAAGHHGWELVTAVADVGGNEAYIGSTYTFCFKRPLPLEPAAAPAPGGPPGADLGVGHAELVGAIENARGIPDYEGRTLRGVRLHDVVEGSTLARAGFVDRDVVVEVAGQPVASIDDVRAGVRAAAGRPLLRVEVRRGSTPRTIEIRLR